MIIIAASLDDLCSEKICNTTFCCYYCDGRNPGYYELYIIVRWVMLYRGYYRYFVSRVYDLHYLYKFFMYIVCTC